VIPLFTRMTGKSSELQQSILSKFNLKHLETNEEVEKIINHLIEDKDTRSIILAAAMCDFSPSEMVLDGSTFIDDRRFFDFGKDKGRLSSSKLLNIHFEPTEKIIDKIREKRKDIFLVSFKTTAGESKEDSYAKAPHNLKRSSSNLVFVNDIQNKHNGIVTPEEFPYWGDNREDALNLLASMTMARIELSFDRTEVIDPELRFPIGIDESFGGSEIPSNFKTVLKHLIDNKAFKHFRGKTSGHFGCKINKTNITLSHGGRELKAIRLCSRRKMDHNTILNKDVGLGIIFGKNSLGTILASGGKPSVGEHTQDAIYENLGDKIHSIVHFHCPLRNEKNNDIPLAEQKPYECGSRECGDNTVVNMKLILPGVYAVHLIGHGPNIAFHKDVPAEIINQWIDKVWDLSDKTGGLV